MTAVTLSRLPGYRGAELTLDNPDVLDLLMALPVGMPVPYQNLTVWQQGLVRRAPAGALDVTVPRSLAGDCTVTRIAVRPCRVAIATVRSATALCSASRFAPFAARQVIVRRRPKLPETLIEYGFWGVGLLLDRGDGELDTLFAPTPWRPKRHTAAGWRFAETAYAAHLAEEPPR
ncbi:hypothetical protein ACIQ7D_17960 [Streptomyces sp. NPDC096310]|uniref:hypothetical protein n=1 Tax=Streptomyces sp. NPDC096310 TaxID=3366082 RepID=UPI00380505D1